MSLANLDTTVVLAMVGAKARKMVEKNLSWWMLQTKQPGPKVKQKWRNDGCMGKHGENLRRSRLLDLAIGRRRMDITLVPSGHESPLPLLSLTFMVIVLFRCG